MDNHKDLLLIDKSSGMSSFDVIRELRKRTGVRKMGHAGTLDPLATGLLIIGVEKGTKKLADLVGLDKTYEVTVEVGERRDTGDKEGRILKEEPVNHALDRKKINSVLESLVGTVRLPVPRYSAVKVDGEPLYKKARRGDDFDPPERDMKIHKLTLKKPHFNEAEGRVFLEITMQVASGVYVRSIAVEIGRRLGYPAVVSHLRRTKVGNFSVSDAQTLQSFN